MSDSLARIVSAEKMLINELKLGYFNKDLQEGKNDPCVIDAMIDWTIRTAKRLPSVKPQPKIDEIIKRIEQARDKDKIAEYPYNRCIDIVREVLGNEKDRKD